MGGKKPALQRLYYQQCMSGHQQTSWSIVGIYSTSILCQALPWTSVCITVNKRDTVPALKKLVGQEWIYVAWAWDFHKEKIQNYGHKSWYKSKHLFRMRKILQQITVVLEIQIPYFLRSLQGIYQKYRYLLRNVSNHYLAPHPPSTFHGDSGEWGVLKFQLP